MSKRDLKAIVQDLPRPLIPRTGWPWTTDGLSFDDSSSNRNGDEGTWPRVSIITPSFNQGQYIEETIRSVLLQDYPNLEYIIMDGGSTDDTVETIRRYGALIDHFESAPDKGQADAINKGFARCTGDIIGWLNSDDTFEPHAIRKAVHALQIHPEYQTIYGNGWYMDENSRRIAHCESVQPGFSRRCLINLDPIVQPASFWRKALFDKTGPLNVDLNWGFDWDWYIRANTHTGFFFLPEYLASYRRHSQAKTETRTQRRERQRELARMSRRHGGWYHTILYFASIPANGLGAFADTKEIPDFLRKLLIVPFIVPLRVLKRLLRLYYRH